MTYPPETGFELKLRQLIIDELVKFSETGVIVTDTDRFNEFLTLDDLKKVLKDYHDEEIL